MFARAFPTARGAVTVKALGLIMAITLGLAACSINWTNGVNYGVIIEPGAGRASVGIYRAARKALHDVMYSNGIGATADLLYAAAHGPLSKLPELCVESVCIGATTLEASAHSIIYDHLADLQNSIIDATNNTDCLAVTLISGLVPTVNWTHKDIGCIIGKVM